MLPRLAHRHGLSASEIDDPVDALSIQAEVIEPATASAPDLRDPKDHDVLGTLLAALQTGAADYLVSGGKDLLALGERHPIVRAHTSRPDGTLVAGVDPLHARTASAAQRAGPVAQRRREGVARSALSRSNQVTQASSDPIQWQGPPARRANEGLDAQRANHATCAAETGHMDATAEPFGRYAPTLSLATLAW